MAVVGKVGNQDWQAPAARERGHVDPRQSTAAVAPVPAVGRLHDVGPAVAGDIADHLISVVAGRWPQLCPCHVRHNTALVDYLEVAAFGEIRECAVAEAAILLPGVLGHEGRAGRIVPVAGAPHDAPRPPPETLL